MHHTEPRTARGQAMNPSPEQFRAMLIEALDDPATARLAAKRLLLPAFPIQGGACNTFATTIGHGDFGSGCGPADTGDYTFAGGGKVGIGTTAPADLLEVSKSQNAGTVVRITNADNVGSVAYSSLRFYQGATLRAGVNSVNDGLVGAAGGPGAMQLWNTVNGNMVFGTNNTEKVRITSGGNVGIATTSPLVKLDARGTNAKGTTAALENIFEVASTDATSPLALRAGIKTDATAGSRYGAIEVDDAGTKRPLALQPTGGNVGIGTTNPKRPLHVKGGDILLEQDPTAGGGFALMESGQSDPTTVMYRAGGTGAGKDFTILRNFNVGQTNPPVYTILKIWAPSGAVVNDREATLTLARGDNDEEYMDVYNNGYTSETQYGIRIQKRGTGVYRDFVIDKWGGTGSKVPLLVIKTESGNVGVGNASPNFVLHTSGAAVALGAPSSAPTDANLNNSNISFWLDETTPALKVRVKLSNGTLKTATIGLV